MLRRFSLMSASLTLAAAFAAAPVRAEDDAAAAAEAPAEAPEAPAAAPETPAEPAPVAAPAAPKPAAPPPAPEKPKPMPAPIPAAPAAPTATPAPVTPPAAEKPKPAPVVKAAPAPSCLLSGPASESVGCVKAYKTLADGYLEAYKAVDRWLAGLSSEMKSAADRIADMEAKVAESEAAVTKLKLDRSKEAKLKLKELETANKKLWVELEAARKDEETRCKGFAREAATKVKEINVDITARLAAAAAKAAQ